MLDGYLEYPDYKKKYPDKTIEDWHRYRNNVLYPMMLESFEEEKETLTADERKEAENLLAEMKSKL